MSHADLLRQRVGAFFTNTYGVSVEGICCVCRGPSTSGNVVCSQCAACRSALGGLTCDHTIIFTYAQGHLPELHQSAHTVRAYKDKFNPVLKCAQDMSLTVKVGTEIHAECIANHVGRRWDSVTFVPSSHQREGKHPVIGITNSVAQVSDQAYGLKKFLIEASTSEEARKLVSGRVPSPARFSVPVEFLSSVEGRHVLLVDDTWTSGASIQSAAAALKLAGAASVTGLCVARWLSANWSEHAALMKTLTYQYEPGRCVIHGTMCNPGTAAVY